MNNPWAMRSRVKLTALALGSLVGLSACLVAPPEESGAANALDGRIDFSTTLLSDGDVLVVGGQEGRETLNDVRLYHPDTGRWTVVDPLHQGRSSHRSLRLPSGKVLVLVGEQKDSSTGMTSPQLAVELYDPAAGRWSLAAPMPQARTGTQVTLLRNGLVLVTGGSTSSNSTVRVDLYDPLTNQWSERAPMLLPRAGHTAQLLPDGKVLVAGGQSSARRPEAEVYDPDTNTWAFTRPMNSHHYQSRAYPGPDGQVLLIAGSGLDELYEPAGGTWRVVPVYDTGTPPGSFSTRTPLPDGRVLFSGGSSGPTASEYTNHVKAYDMRTHRWTSLAPMPEARVGHESVLLGDGKVVMLGGWAPGRSAARHPVMTYDPGTDTWE